MTVTRSLLLLLVAIACFVVALCIALGWITGNETAFQDGGLIAFAGSFLP